MPDHRGVLCFANCRLARERLFDFGYFADRVLERSKVGSVRPKEHDWWRSLPLRFRRFAPSRATAAS